MTESLERLKTFIKLIPDFPKPGILYRDLSPIYAEPSELTHAVTLMRERIREFRKAHHGENFVIVAPESRGFILGSIIAHLENLPLVLARKFGKTPGKPLQHKYQTEYSVDMIEMGRDLLVEGQKIIIIDDVLASGGTMRAIDYLTESTGAEVIYGIALIGIKEFEHDWKQLPFKTESILIA